jgi:hypothetical protein
LPLTGLVAVLLGHCYDGIDRGCKSAKGKKILARWRAAVVQELSTHFAGSHHRQWATFYGLLGEDSETLQRPFANRLWARDQADCWRQNGASLNTTPPIFFEKRIFLYARFPPRREAGDVRILGGRSPRPPLELVIADFLITAATNSVHAAGIGAAGKEKKKNIFVRAIPTSWWGWRLQDLGGGRSLRPPLELVVAGFLIAAATDSCALAVFVCNSSLYTR